MNKKSAAAKVDKSFAEEGLEALQGEGDTLGIDQVSSDLLTVAEEPNEMQQVGGLEPIKFFYRTSPPKTTPKHPYKVFAKGETISGVYERSFASGQYNNRTYIIRLEGTGELVGLPGSGSLQHAMDKLSEGSKVQIIYHGMGTIKSGKWAGRDAHNFTVFGNKLK